MMNIDNGEIVYEEDYYYINLDRIPDELALLEWVHHLLVTKNFPDHYKYG
jgi:cell division septal protein FtsQ